MPNAQMAQRGGGNRASALEDTPAVVPANGSNSSQVLSTSKKQLKHSSTASNQGTTPACWMPQSVMNQPQGDLRSRLTCKRGIWLTAASMESAPKAAALAASRWSSRPSLSAAAARLALQHDHMCVSCSQCRAVQAPLSKLIGQWPDTNPFGT